MNMAQTMAQEASFVIKNIFFLGRGGLFLLAFTLSTCHALPQKGQLVLPSGLTLETRLAITPREQARGLSGIPSEQFKPHQGLLFLYKKVEPRSFWMPDTYFNLHIIFLDKNLKVLSIERNVPAHPGRKEPPPIYRTPMIRAMHVLEIRADSPAAQQIEKGMVLKWISSMSLSQIISNIRPSQ